MYSSNTHQPVFHKKKFRRLTFKKTKVNKSITKQIPKPKVESILPLIFPINSEKEQLSKVDGLISQPENEQQIEQIPKQKDFDNLQLEANDLLINDDNLNPPKKKSVKQKQIVRFDYLKYNQESNTPLINNNFPKSTRLQMKQNQQLENQLQINEQLPQQLEPNNIIINQDKFKPPQKKHLKIQPSTFDVQQYNQESSALLISDHIPKSTRLQMKQIVSANLQKQSNVECDQLLEASQLLRNSKSYSKKSKQSTPKKASKKQKSKNKKTHKKQSKKNKIIPVFSGNELNQGLNSSINDININSKSTNPQTKSPIQTYKKQITKRKPNNIQARSPKTDDTYQSFHPPITEIYSQNSDFEFQLPVKRKRSQSPLEFNLEIEPQIDHENERKNINEQLDDDNDDDQSNNSLIFNSRGFTGKEFVSDNINEKDDQMNQQQQDMSTVDNNENFGTKRRRIDEEDEQEQ